MARQQVACGSHGLALDLIAVEGSAVADEGASKRAAFGQADERRVGRRADGGECAGVRLRADAVSTPTRLPASRLMCSSADVATGTGEQAERSSW